MLTSSWNSPRGVPVVLAAVVDARCRMDKADLLEGRLGAWKRVIGSRVLAYLFPPGGEGVSWVGMGGGLGVGWGWTYEAEDHFGL